MSDNLHPIAWAFDADTREYVAFMVEDSQHVEVDRLPASTAAGGQGSLRADVQGMRDRAGAAEVSGDAAKVRDAIRGGPPE